jgi:hypothetical protein
MNIFGHCRQSMVAAICFCAISAGSNSAWAGTKIEFTDPEVSVERVEKPKRDEIDRTRFQLKSSPVDNLTETIMPYHYGQQNPKKDKDKDKETDWLSQANENSKESLISSKKSGAGPLPRTWGKNNPSDSDLFGMSLSDRNADKTGKSTSGWLGNRERRENEFLDRRLPQSSSLSGSAIEALRTASQNHLDELQRQNDRQARMAEFNKLYNTPLATAPVGTATGTTTLHESLWKTSGRTSSFGEPSSRDSSSQMQPTSPLAVRVQPWESSSRTAPATPTRSRYKDAEETSQNNRAVAPNAFEIPRPPNSAFR